MAHVMFRWFQGSPQGRNSPPWFSSAWEPPSQPRNATTPPPLGLRVQRRHVSQSRCHVYTHRCQCHFSGCNVQCNRNSLSKHWLQRLCLLLTGSPPLPTPIRSLPVRLPCPHPVPAMPHKSLKQGHGRTGWTSISLRRPGSAARSLWRTLASTSPRKTHSFLLQ